jgi:hypothetical protein
MVGSRPPWRTDAGFSLGWFYPVAMKYSNGCNFRDENLTKKSTYLLVKTKIKFGFYNEK